MDLIGRVVGNYRITAKLGEGGMGQVFRGAHLRLDREVAVKAFVSQTMGDDQVRDRMIREQQILDQLHHPHIVALHDICFEADAVFLVMELVHGETLGQHIARVGPLPVEQVLLFARQLLDALALAHGKGIIHRDIKPANLMVMADGGGIKLLDFGIARATDSAGLTQTGMVLGSPAYLPPERWEDRPVTPATDIYALGLCLYEALAGRAAHRTDRGWQAFYKLHLKGQVDDLGAMRPDAPPWLVAAIHQAIRVEPADRFSDAASMLAALGEAPAPAPAPALPLDVHWTERAAAAMSDPSQGQSSRTRAFLVKAGRPWKRIAQGLAVAGALAFLGLVGGAVVIAAAIVVYALVVHKPPPVFVLELNNGQGARVELFCSAGAGDNIREWTERIPPGDTASIAIPTFPASCWQVQPDGQRELVWTTPVWATIGAEPDLPTLPEAQAPDPEGAELAAARAVPEEGQREIMGMKPAAAAEHQGRAEKPKPKTPEPEVATIWLVDRQQPQPAPAGQCSDLVALEPAAMLGQLDPTTLFCLESAIGHGDLTGDDKRSRLLIANAYGRNDQVAWERLVRRHLDKISLGDPELCLLFATHQYRKLDASAKAEAIQYANYGLENKDRLRGPTFVKRVSTLHQVRTIAALDLWQRYDRQYIKDRKPETEEYAEKARGLAKEYARAWYEFVEAAGGDAKPALAACRSASGTKDYCQ
ncbi:MAG: serine/threonine-protein kinase [Pseudomonadota bacterium]